MFSVGSGVTLALGNNITLQGSSSNSSAVVQVNSGGTLIMESGSVITGNTTSVWGSGVRVENDGAFTMNGGEIKNNTAGIGGGGVNNDGTLTMNGGEIKNNTASSDGGGVRNYGTFIKTGGKIAGNPSSFGANTAGTGNAVYSSSSITIGGVSATAFNDDLDETENTP
jgi:hypothetical protein